MNISGEHIIRVSTNTDIPTDTEVIDFVEATLLPGLAELHTHVTFNVDDLGSKGLAKSRTDEAIRGIVNARKPLMSGFIIARNSGAAGYSDVSVRDTINSGAILGPRLQVFGVPLCKTAGHCDDNKLPFDYKVSAAGGTTSKGAQPGVRQDTFEELQSIVDEAHIAGMPIAADTHGTEGILFAIQAGVDSIGHVARIV